MKALVEKLRSFKGANIIIFLVFAITIYLQCNFFHKNLNFPGDPSLGYMHLFKISIAFAIASLVFFFKGKSWTLWVSVFINTWGISNLMYRRANQIVLDAYSITMVDNMDGFWSSVPFYMDINDFSIYYTTAILAVAFFLFKNKNRQIWGGIVAMILGIGIHIWGYEQRVRTYTPYAPFIENKLYNPFALDQATFVCWDLYDKVIYTRETSILHHFIYQTHYFVRKILFASTYTLTEDENAKVSTFINNGDNPTPSRPLFVILIESFETWALRPDIMPNLYNFIQGENILFAPKIKCQTRGGTSADGQMLVNTGLLPTKEGAVCFRYPNNTFPSLSRLYKNTFNIIPGGQTVWNQAHMNTAYKIKDSFDGPFNDRLLVAQFIEEYKKYDYGMLLTMATHSPFTRFVEYANITLPSEMPTFMANYLKSFNYTDSRIKPLLDAIKNDDYLKNAVVIITGDHTVFPQSRRNEFSKYCNEKQDYYDVNDNYCPLIIYSPDIKEKKIVNEVAYQMDIYTTLLHIINCENYYWKGFGINLLNEDSSKRKISAEDALELSDKLHQANYFKEIEKQ